MTREIFSSLFTFIISVTFYRYIVKISDVEADCCRHSPAAAQGCASAGRLAALAALNGKLKLQKRQVNYQASTTHRGCQIKNI